MARKYLSILSSAAALLALAISARAETSASEEKANRALQLASEYARGASEHPQVVEPELARIFLKLSDKLQQARVVFKTLPEGVLAAARPGMNSLLISEAHVREHGEEFLAQTFIHEELHVLGFTDECNVTALEGLATYLGAGRLIYPTGYWQSCFQSVFVERSPSRPLYVGRDRAYHVMPAYSRGGEIRESSADQLATGSRPIIGLRRASLLRDIFDVSSGCQQHIVCHDY